MKNPKILITGASGCVGQYISSWLFKNTNAYLYLYLRDSRKLTAINKFSNRIKILEGDLRDSHLFANEIAQVTRVIHTATAWGDPKRAYEVNVKAVKKLLDLLNSEIIEQIIYFSTASIVDENIRPLKEALTYGTEYIQTKAECLQQLEQHPYSSKIVAVFPTLVFGGKADNSSKYPTSYLTKGLKDAFQWIWLARWFKAYSKFHFIHAEDIAFICGKLATEPHSENQKYEGSMIRKLVLGQKQTSIDEAVDILIKFKGMRKVPRIPLYDWLLNLLITILPIQTSKWDRFSIQKRHFTHKPITNPESFLGTSFARDLEEVIINSGLAKRE